MIAVEFPMQRRSQHRANLRDGNRRVDFFPLPVLLREKPGRYQRKRLMMMPAPPRPNFIIGQAGFALGSPKTFFDAMLRLGTRANSASGVSGGAFDR